MWWVILFIVVLLVILYIIFPPVLVCGTSMFPSFNDGDIIICCRLKHIKIGNVYVFKPPVHNDGEKYVIKRLTHISEITGKMFFEGDNKDHSYDSRMYGYIGRDKLIARYVFTIFRRKECK